MIVRFSEEEFIDLCNNMPTGQFIEMDDDTYQQLVRKAETLAYRLRNFQTVRPILVSLMSQKKVS